MSGKSGGQYPPLSNRSGERSLVGQSDSLKADRKRNLQLLRAGSSLLGIFEDEIATIAAWREPTPLPYAPRLILGVVSIQGRMLTVLDLAALLSPEALAIEGLSQHIIALRGDEQLALAVDGLDETIGISEEEAETEKGLFLRVFELENRRISILNTKELFATALQGRERRRRRF